jgi:dipeptidyl-peptidase-4
MTELTLERLFASPSLAGAPPLGIKYAPDGRRVTFLKAKPEDQQRYDLWQFEVETGLPSLLVDSRLLEPDDIVLSEEEKALRERKRTAGKTGILDYSWGTANTILVPLGGNLHLVTLTADGPQTRQLTDSDAFDYDARISPRGTYASFIRDGALWIIDLTTGTEKRLSPQADLANALSYGVAEFVAQEEMSRYTGYWWSPDDKYLAYIRVDESPVDIVPRFDISADDVAVIEQRYPRAGRPNAIVDLFVLEVDTGIVTEIAWRRKDWGHATDQYLARVNWTEDSLFVQRVNRAQTQLEMVQFMVFHPANKGLRLYEATVAKLDEQPHWINLSSDFESLGPQGVIVTEESKGYRQISRLPPSTNHPKPLIGGDWVVDAIQHVNADEAEILFTGFRDTPLERHLYRAQMASLTAPDDVRIDRITALGGVWSITMAPDGKSFVGTSSSPDQPSQTGLYSKDGTLIAWIEENTLNEDHPYHPFLADHATPDFGTLTADDGQTLHYSLLKPPGFDPAKRYPAIIEVYGGPHVQTVTKSWGSLSDQYLARQGYLVFRLDNRGTWNRGKQFEDVIHHRTGLHEVSDQMKGVDWLKAQSFVDANRIAIQGWSYGGYMTLMTILQAPAGTFAAAVAGAAVADWSLYDTFYTERYMGTPQTNAGGYEASSVFPYLENLSSPLLLLHGMADDNVTFDNATRVMAKLQELGKPFDLMTYPGQRHGIRGEALQRHLMQTRMSFLNRILKRQTP